MAREPIRTCVGCRHRGPWSEFLRFVLAPNSASALLADERRRLDGRGAWLHPDPACLDKALTKGAFARALRVVGPLDATAAIDAITARINHLTDQDQTVKAGQSDGHPMSTSR